MRIGLFHTTQWPENTDQPDRYREAIEQALFVEQQGFDSIWLTEHHFSRHGIISDSLNVLSHLAAKTENIRLGTAVSVLPLHNPIRLAESAGTVDQLSGGRLDFGVGKGYQVAEFEGFGVDLAEREERFDEALDIILQSWTCDAPFSYEGRYLQVSDVNPQPKPVQRPHPPVWMATDSDSGFRKCAERGWGVLLPQGRSIQAVADQLGRYKAALAAAGQPFDSEKVILARALYVAPTDEQAWEEVSGPYSEFLGLADRLAGPGGSPSRHGGGNPFALSSTLEDAALFGSPETCAARLAALEEVGITRTIMFVHIGGLLHDQIMRSLKLFAAEVMSTVR